MLITVKIPDFTVRLPEDVMPVMKIEHDRSLTFPVTTLIIYMKGYEAFIFIKLRILSQKFTSNIL